MQTTKIHYRKEESTGFYNTLRKRVNEALLIYESKPCFIPAAKAIILSSMYAFFLILIFTSNITSVILFSYVFLGVLTIGIFLNVVHDAAHNALFKNNFWNNVSMNLLEIFGADAYIWKKRHIRSHHSYPNINRKDYDIRQSNLLRILPNTPFLAHHRYQPYYVPLVYLLYTMNWLFHRDFVDAFFHAVDLNVSNRRKVKMVIHKIIYVFFFIVFPSLISGKAIGIYFLGFLFMHFTASAIGVMALTTAHVSHDSEFPEPDENGMMPDSWAMHQLKVTQDFATNNIIVSACFGGFNFHIAHHLFPSVQHRHYKKITGIIKSTAEEFGVDYKLKSLPEALRSHYLLLINNSRKPIEIDM